MIDMGALIVADTILLINIVFDSKRISVEYWKSEWSAVKFNSPNLTDKLMILLFMHCLLVEVLSAKGSTTILEQMTSHLYFERGHAVVGGHLFSPLPQKRLLGETLMQESRILPCDRDTHLGSPFTRKALDTEPALTVSPHAEKFTWCPFVTR